MTQNVLEFGAVRASDPQSSHDAAATAPVRGQKATILRWLHTWAARAGYQVPVTADLLYEAYPESDRGTWSTRLSGMEHDELVVCVGFRDSVGRKGGRPRKVKAYSLTDAGRVAAARLAHPSTVTR